MACTVRSLERPLSILMASLGPTPLTVISRSNSRFSSRSRKPNSAIWSSLTCVWMCSEASAPTEGSAVNVGTEMVTS